MVQNDVAVRAVFSVRERARSDAGLIVLGWAFVSVFLGIAVFNGLTTPMTTSDDWGTKSPASALGYLLMVLLFPAVAQLIILRRPRNRMAWLLHAIGLGWGLTLLSDGYSRLALISHVGSWPGGEIVEAIGTALWVPPVLMLGVYVPLLFPDGRLPSPRWRWPARLAAADGLLLFLGIVLSPGPIEDASIPLAENPIGVGALKVPLMVLQVVVLPLLPICFLAAAFSIVLRYRRAGPEQRAQLKWFLYAVAVIALGFAAAMTASFSTGSDEPVVGFLQAFALFAFGLIPVAIGVAITRYNLYGIDALISRTLTIGALGAFITAVYVGIVVGIGALIGQRRPSVWLSVLATAVVAVVFQPVRERVNRWANRLVYGARATPYEVLSDFAVQMGGRFTPTELMPQLARTLVESLGGGKVGIWLRTANEPALEAAWPDGVGAHEVTSAEADESVVVRHRDEELGAITVTKHAHEPLTRAERDMLQHVASQVGLVLRNLRLVEDLQSSRERLVSSQDDERRRLERDLHDGAQQSLVSVALLLQVAAAQSSPNEMAASIGTASEQLRTAIAELRELAHGIHPAILTERGLGPALRTLAQRSAVPVTLDLDLPRRADATVEATLYFAVAEALANVGKYAQARAVSITGRDVGSSLEVVVVDDGVGGADLAAGTGLLGLVDRLSVVHGTLELHSPPGQGTRLVCSVPLVDAAIRR